jgi:hypothetical protein
VQRLFPVSDARAQHILASGKRLAEAPQGAKADCRRTPWSRHIANQAA